MQITEEERLKICEEVKRRIQNKVYMRPAFSFFEPGKLEALLDINDNIEIKLHL